MRVIHVLAFLGWFIVGWVLASIHNNPTEVVCNPTKVIAMHEHEKIYPAWSYHCAEGYTVVILD